MNRGEKNLRNRLLTIVSIVTAALLFLCSRFPADPAGNDAVSIPLSSSYSAHLSLRPGDPLSIASIFPQQGGSTVHNPLKKTAAAAFTEARVMVLNEFNAQSQLATAGRADFYCAMSESNVTSFYGKELDRWDDLLTGMSRYISLDLVYTGTPSQNNGYVEGDIQVRTGANLVLVCFIDGNGTIIWTTGAEYIHKAEAIRALAPQSAIPIVEGWQADAVWDSATQKYDTTVWKDSQYVQSTIRDSSGIFTGYILPKVGAIGYTRAYADSACSQYRRANSVTSGSVAYTDSVTDSDGNKYYAVTIGTQTWLTEDLRTTKYNDGSPITLDTSFATWTSAATPYYCFYNNTTNTDSIKKFGALYNGYVVNPANAKKIAPQGWHVPSDAEWDTLQNYLIAKGYNWDKTTDSNKIAKSLTAKTDWLSDTVAGTPGNNLTTNNSSGFSAMPVGYRNGSGFCYRSISCAWWSGTASSATSAWVYTINYNNTPLYRVNCGNFCGFSVRLVRD